MSRITEHLAKFHREIIAMEKDGHMEDFEVAKAINGIEYELFEIQKIEERKNESKKRNKS